MQASDIIAIITLIITAVGGSIGGTFAILQWRKSNKIKQAEFINQIIEKLRFDKDIAKTMYMIDYANKTWYDESFHGGELEVEVDALLSYVTYICYLYSTKSISKNEFCVLEYEVKRVCLNRQAQAYLWNLYHWSKRCNTLCSFQNLIEYLRSEVLNSEQQERFDSKESNVSGYIKHLNF